MDRAELARFLRSRRARLGPAQAGLPDLGQRRTPGLRRQEVAQLAGISIDYYIRMEQGRGPHPSRQVLSALARALLLSADERQYLFRLAGAVPPPAARVAAEVTPGIRNLLDSLAETPAYVVDAKYDVLAWNALATHFIGDLSGLAPAERNMLRWLFRLPATAVIWTDAESARFNRSMVADLRTAYASYPADPGIRGLVSELLGTSARFARLWAEHEVETKRPIVKRIEHPVAGPLEFECQVLHLPDAGQRIIVYCAAPGSPTQEAFRRLAAASPGAAVRAGALPISDAGA